jgi:hypothetical protein
MRSKSEYGPGGLMRASKEKAAAGEGQVQRRMAKQGVPKGAAASRPLEIKPQNTLDKETRGRDQEEGFPAARFRWTSSALSARP